MSDDRDALRRRFEGPRPGVSLVLLVDDDPVTAALVESALSSPAREVWSVGSIGAAEAFAASHDIALVVLDLMLPDGDGRRFLEALRRDRRTSDVPVFILTSRFSRQVEEECYRLGADGFFEKPGNVAILAAAVQSRLERRAAPKRAAETPAVIPPGATVLVIEDDPITAELVRHRLAREGMGVRHVADGGEAQELIAREAPCSAVVLDLKLPGRSGFDILARMRAQMGWRDVPVLVLSSLGDEQNLERAFTLGASDYLVKPFSPTELLARVKRLLA